jgi:hypothetical protein
VNRIKLRGLIERSLKSQGFRLRANAILPPKQFDKDRVRQMHRVAVLHKRQAAEKTLKNRENELLLHFADGIEIDPRAIIPKIVEVKPDSLHELLFRYAALHWSIPVSSGYGRRLRFLVFDQTNKKIIGLIGLADPVFNLGARDEWIGWDPSTREQRLRYVMDAFVLGAVPPYSMLLCGKLVAMLVTSDEVRIAFSRKYARSASRITARCADPRLALITTTSALGRSSIYNRLRLGDTPLFVSVGFTRGSGEFHFANGVYSSIAAYAARYCVPTAKKAEWGDGFRSRREVLKKCLPKLGISTEWLYHGVEREIFVVPLARNSRQFLSGQHSRLQWFHRSTIAISDYFASRWLLPRLSQREYKGWRSNDWRLWP